MTDRSIAPDISNIQTISFQSPQYSDVLLPIHTWICHDPKHPIIKIEWQVPAGRWYQHYPLQSSLALAMLKEGTAQKDSKTIAELLEYYGGKLSINADSTNATVTLMAYKKYLTPLLDLLREILFEASFPEKEWHTLLSISKQKHLVNTQKNDYIANKESMRQIFGAAHPYAYYFTMQDYENIQLEQCKDYYKNIFLQKNGHLFLSGDLSTSEIETIQNIFRLLPSCTTMADKHPIVSDLSKNLTITKDKSAQASIRLSSHSISKNHPDYMPLQVSNTVLGGYFGSRLMSNIREDKGYTYGIYSSLTPYLHSGLWQISTEVGVDVCDASLQEIYHEIDRMQDTLCDDEELQAVRNSMLMEFLSATDGCFNQIDTVRGLYSYGLQLEDFQSWISTIQNISAQEIQAISQKYFRKENIYECVVR